MILSYIFSKYFLNDLFIFILLKKYYNDEWAVVVIQLLERL